MAATADIKHILNLFDNFVNVYETDNWLNTVTVEEIKNSFKLAKNIENTIVNLESKECTGIFTRTLNLWWKNKNRKAIYDINFFVKACDNLLEKFFLKNIPIDKLDAAIRMYTSLFPKERFEKVVSVVLLTSTSYTELVDHIVAQKDHFDLKRLQLRLLLRSWVQECQCGRTQNIEEIIKSMLSSYTIKKSLSILISLLTIWDSEEDEIVKSIILNNLFAKMDDRSVLSKQFWMSLFNDVDKMYLSKVCVKYKTFFKKLVDFIVYIACMMNWEVSNNFEMVWAGDQAMSICPDLTYDSLVGLTKFLCNYHLDLRTFIELRIKESKTTLDPLLWDQFSQEI